LCGHSRSAWNERTSYSPSRLNTGASFIHTENFSDHTYTISLHQLQVKMALPSFLSLFQSQGTIISRDLCDLCRLIDFRKADCSIGRGGYKHYSSHARLLISARNGYKLCKLVSEDSVGDVAQLSRDEFENKQIYCNIKHKYPTDEDDYRGSKKHSFCRENVPFSALYMFTPAGNFPKCLGVLS
jgi:hypothetical protein